MSRLTWRLVLVPLGTNYAVSATWLRPTNVLTAQMFKVDVQLEF